MKAALALIAEDQKRNGLAQHMGGGLVVGEAGQLRKLTDLEPEIAEQVSTWSMNISPRTVRSSCS
jgi:hypothetical protein